MDDDFEEIAQAWLDFAKRHRKHVEKYPNCIDRDERLRSAALYERYAAEQRAENKNAKSAVQLSPEGDQRVSTHGHSEECRQD